MRPTAIPYHLSLSSPRSSQIVTIPIITCNSLTLICIFSYLRGMICPNSNSNSNDNWQGGRESTIELNALALPILGRTYESESEPVLGLHVYLTCFMKIEKT